MGDDRNTEALTNLVREALDEPGVSLRTLAARTADQAGRDRINKDYWQRLSKGTMVNAPSAEDLELIAAALRRPVNVIKAAAARQWLAWEPVELSGYSDDVRQILLRVQAMPPEDQARARALMDALGDAAKNQ